MEIEIYEQGMNSQGKGIALMDWQEVRKILQQNNRIEQAILFGSRAKGTWNKGSDIDIALKGEKLSFRDALDIGIALEEKMFPYTFDVLVYHMIRKKALLDHISRFGVIIYEKQAENT